MSTTQDIEADLFSNIQTGSEIQSSANEDPHVAFIHKCLHPPSAVPSFSGLPTNDTRTQVLVQWRNLQLMVTPRIYDFNTSLVRNVTAADLETFNYVILTMNGARVLSVPFVYNVTASGHALTQDLANVDTQTLYEFANWRHDANLYRPVYRSLTTYLNATAFNDTGTVAGNQFNPNILFGGTIVTLAHENYLLFKHYVRQLHRRRVIKTYHASHRDYNTHSDRFNAFPKFIRDDIVSSECFTLDTNNNFSSTDFTYDLDPNVTIQIVSFNHSNEDIPDLSQILTQSERSYGGRAREGTFTVQRLNTLSPSWLSSSNTLISGTANGLYQCYLFFINETGGHLVPLYDNNPVGAFTSPTYLYDTLWTKDMTWSWTRYEGLSLNAQTSVNTQLLIKKYYTGFEVQPALQSAWAGMVRLAPKPDIASLQLVMDRFYELKDCMPARYNFLGAALTAIAPTLLSALPGIARSVVNFFKPKTVKSSPTKRPRRLPKSTTSLNPHPVSTVPALTGAMRRLRVGRRINNIHPRPLLFQRRRLRPNVKRAVLTPPRRRIPTKKLATIPPVVAPRPIKFSNRL